MVLAHRGLADRRDVVVVGSNPFEARVPLGDWQLARAFARLGHRVVYVDPATCVFRPGRPTATPRLVTDPDGASPVHVLTPQVPTARRPWLTSWMLDDLVTRQVRRLLGRTGVRNPLVVLVRPERGIWRGLSAGPTVYWQKDRQWASTQLPRPDWTRARHDELLRAADVVTGVSQTIVDDCSAAGVHCELVPNGVDPLWSRRNTREATAPTAVFVGAVGGRLDFDLLDRVVMAKPTMRFRLVGPGDLPARFATYPNVEVTGRVDYFALPRLVEDANVAVVPYRASTFNEASCPLKVWELTAAGLPVVASGIGRDLDLPHLQHARDADEFVHAIDAALRSGGLESRWVADFVHGQSWERRAERLLALTDDAQRGEAAEVSAKRRRFPSLR